MLEALAQAASLVGSSSGLQTSLVGSREHATLSCLLPRCFPIYEDPPSWPYLFLIPPSPHLLMSSQGRLVVGAGAVGFQHMDFVGIQISHYKAPYLFCLVSFFPLFKPPRWPLSPLSSSCLSLHLCLRLPFLRTLVIPLGRIIQDDNLIWRSAD